VTTKVQERYLEHMEHSTPHSKDSNPALRRTSSSCDFAMSTNVLAAGCTMSRSLMIVAPSLEIVTLVPSWISLSIPQGPRVVLRISVMASQALMLLMI
jgi:hypothetical protein